MKKESKDVKNNPFKQDAIENSEVSNDDEKLNEELNNEANAQTENNSSEWEEKYTNLNNQYIRLAADFDNFRKRQEQEKESLLKFGTQEALRRLLVVLDNFERGEKSFENVEDINQIKDSFKIIHNQMIDELKKMGLEEIEAVGKEFDPNLHEAVMQTQSDEYQDNEIVAELQKGYKYNDKVLRASLVNVARN